MSIIELFGKNVRKYRTALGVSQEKFAELCGLHRTYISDIECFQRNVSLETIDKISKALDVQAYVLLLNPSEDNKI